MLLVGTLPSTLAASASHAPAARLGNPPRRLKNKTSRWRGRGHTDAPKRRRVGGGERERWWCRCSFSPGVETRGRFERRDGCPCFLGSTEERRKRWEYYAGVPSLSAFLNPPTLRPSPALSLSLLPAPTSSAPDCCSGWFFFCFFFVFLFYFLLHIQSDSDLNTAIHLITLLYSSRPNGRVTHITPFFLLPFLHINFLYLLALRLSS